MTKHFVYILECEDGSYYTGYTTNVDKRFKAHCSGRGAKYTRSHKPVKVVLVEEFQTKSDAMKMEYQIKQLPHNTKAWLIKSWNETVVHIPSNWKTNFTCEIKDLEC